MSASRRRIVSADEAAELADLIEFVERDVPPPYRAVVLAHLLRRGTAPAGGGPARAAPHVEAPPRGRRGRAVADDLSRYTPLLRRRGQPLLKALVVLHSQEASRSGPAWMTPAEISAILRDAAGVTSAYRSNLSNALRREAAFVSRRRRGRGFEYALTARGRRHVDRQVDALG